jgi:small subunit ribosomal protein S36
VNRVEVMGAPQPPLSSDDHPIEIGLGDLHVRAEAIHMAQHPPLWYWIAGALDRGAGTGDDDDLRLRSQRFRWLNVTFLVAAAVLTVEAGRRIGLSPAAAMLAAVIPALSPRWMWSGATANNDTILVALTAVLILLIARGEMFAGTWQVVAGGLALGFALLSKVFALALIGWLICVSLRRSWRGREWSALRRTGVVIALGMIVGGWWWLRNLMVYGRLQPRTRPATVDPGFEPSLIEFGRDFTVRFIESSWLTLGGTGGLGVPFGPVLAGSVVVVGMFAVGLARAGARRGSPSTSRPSPFW